MAPLQCFFFFCLFVCLFFLWWMVIYTIPLVINLPFKFSSKPHHVSRQFRLIHSIHWIESYKVLHISFSCLCMLVPLMHCCFFTYLWNHLLLMQIKEMFELRPRKNKSLSHKPACISMWTQLLPHSPTCRAQFFFFFLSLEKMKKIGHETAKEKKVGQKHYKKNFCISHCSVSKKRNKKKNIALSFFDKNLWDKPFFFFFALVHILSNIVDVSVIWIKADQTNTTIIMGALVIRTCQHCFRLQNCGQRKISTSLGSTFQIHDVYMCVR